MSASALFALSAVGFWGTRELAFPRPDDVILVPIQVEGRTCSIRVEIFSPVPSSKRAEQHPAVVLLHGVEGPNRYGRNRYRAADLLRDQGYYVFVVHYFNSVSYDDLWLLNEDGNLDVDRIEKTRLTDYHRWIAAVKGVVEVIAQRGDVDPERIALDGNSLGGFLALAVAQECLNDARFPKVRAVLVNWGARWRQTKFSPGFPPTLFVHGELDPVVPPAWAHNSADSLRGLGTECEVHVIAGQQHVAQSAESDRAALAFLARHLKPPKSAVLSSEGIVALAPQEWRQWSRDFGVSSMDLR